MQLKYVPKEQSLAMGASFSQCTRADSVQLSPMRGSRSAHEDEISELSLDNRNSDHAATIAESITPEVDLPKALDQIFLLCETGVSSTIQFILDNHPSVEQLINNRKVCHITDTRMELTPLQLAAACGHGEVIRTLCGHTSTLINIADPLFSMTALHLAVHLGQIFAVEALCKDPRCEVDEKNVEGKTAMHIAVAHEYPGIVETMLRLHPNIDLRIKDFDGNNVFHLAAYHPNVKIMTLLANHASMVNLYCEYFDVTKVSAKNRPKTKKQIFETANYNGETAAHILTDAIKRVQKRREDVEAKLFLQEMQLQPLLPPQPPLTGAHRVLLAQQESVMPMPAVATTSPATTDERSEGTVPLLPQVPPVLLLNARAPGPSSRPTDSILVEPDTHNNTLSSLADTDRDPSQHGPYLEDPDLDVLITCLEILHSALQGSPSQQSLSTFGVHSTSAGLMRKNSFDLDSNASQEGEDDAEEPGHHHHHIHKYHLDRDEHHSDTRTTCGTGLGLRNDHDEEEDVMQGRAAYSWSPPFTPSLDQEQPHFFTPKSPLAKSRSTNSSIVSRY